MAAIRAIRSFRHASWNRVLGTVLAGHALSSDGVAVFDEAALLDKLRKIEALHAGATTDGERVAAAFAADRIRRRLADWRKLERDVEMQYSLHDPWGRSLFIALCRRYGLEPYRHARQRRSTLCVKAPRPFHNNTL